MSITTAQRTDLGDDANVFVEFQRYANGPTGRLIKKIEFFHRPGAERPPSPGTPHRASLNLNGEKPATTKTPMTAASPE